MSNKMKSNLFVGAIAVVIAFVGVTVYTRPKANAKNDMREATVMITNTKMNSGGSGLILDSSESNSQILTNGHVCEVVKNGGVVSKNNTSYQVTSYVQSKLYDLCIINVTADLGIDTVVAKKAPAMYSPAFISGHPALLPNVITSGHVSSSKIIQVVMGFRPCTDQEMEDNPLYCVFFGGMPLIRNFQSRLVTATIMPGSSGSGIYNAKEELIGLVFAGSGQLGYAWTVPQEQVVAFLKTEQNELAIQYPNQTVAMNNADSEKRPSFNQIKKKCSLSEFVFPELDSTNPSIQAEKEKILESCKLINQDMLWNN